VYLEGSCVIPERDFEEVVVAGLGERWYYAPDVYTQSRWKLEILSR
jgi:hypothetical protein